MPEFQCSVAANERRENLFATASQVSRWLLVELRHAWGRDAIADGDLANHVPAGWERSLRAQGIRPVAIRRDLRRRDTAQTMRLFHVRAERGSTQPGRLWRREVATLGDVPAATADLSSAGLSANWQEVDETLVLVCTNGRHDPCCATFGRPLVRHLRHTAVGSSVWECSHIGGDRFAANLVVLPQGLYFGRVTIDRVDALLDGLHRGELDLETYRGRSTLRYVEQAAEHFVRRELGLAAVDAIAGVRRSADHVDVELRDGDGFHVELARMITLAPTPLTCRGPADASYPTYRLVDIRRIR
ncbi:MAG: sucrase ferredoxin [Acidimicrobiia bacterium]